MSFLRRTSNRNDRQSRRSDRGSISVVAAVSMVPLLAVGAVLVDSGRTLAERQQLQSAVEAAALRGAYQRISGGSGCADAAGSVAAAVNVTPSVTCLENDSLVVVDATARRSLTLGGLVGRSEATISASTGVTIGAATAMIGVRPLGLCAEHPEFEAWVASQFTDTSTHRINIESDGSLCAGQAPGNWGILDLDGGANSNADTQDWINSGYSGEVRTLSTIGGDPGIPTPAIGIDSIFGIPITIPVFSDVTANGQGATYTIVGFVGIVVESAVLNGAAADRHLIVRFTTDHGTSIATGCCTGLAEVNGGIAAARICSLDESGVC